ncbi:hypothetical protein [Streptomyces sp. ECR3]|uniref:hypothetical protein n=1 Tax=Streptomyces sp. ECR3 TaxID=3400630 RepID=UPI003F1B9707
MKTMIVCVPCGVTLEQVCGELLAAGYDVDSVEHRLTVSGVNLLAWIEVDVDGELEREYEPNERTLIEGIVGKWRAFMIDYRSLESADAVIAIISHKWPCAVDNDDDFLGAAEVYLSRYR